METQVMNEAAMAVTTNENILQWFARFMTEGGVFMFVISFVWISGIILVIDRWNYLKKVTVDGPSFFSQIKRMVISNNVQGAIQICAGSQSGLATVLKNGLKRANQSKVQIQDSMEASMLEVIPKIEQRFNYIALLSNMSTLLGLLGTIQGLIQSFSAVATAEANLKQQLLAKGISVAMNTTAFGLVSAITLLVLHTYLSSQAQKMISDIDQSSVKLVDLLTTKANHALDEAA